MTPHLALGEDYSLDDGFCDFAFGCAQNDSISEGVQVPYWNEGVYWFWCSWKKSYWLVEHDLHGWNMVI